MKIRRGFGRLIFKGLISTAAGVAILLLLLFRLTLPGNDEPAPAVQQPYQTDD
jgi:hypothetical protein